MSWLLLGLGLAFYIHDRIVEASHIHPGFHGLDAGAIFIVASWLASWYVITKATSFWDEIRLFWQRFKARHCPRRKGRLISPNPVKS